MHRVGKITAWQSSKYYERGMQPACSPATWRQQGRGESSAQSYESWVFIRYHTMPNGAASQRQLEIFVYLCLPPASKRQAPRPERRYFVRHETRAKPVITCTSDTQNMGRHEMSNPGVLAGFSEIGPSGQNSNSLSSVS